MKKLINFAKAFLVGTSFQAFFLVWGQAGNVEIDRITPLQGLINALILLAYIIMASIGYNVLRNKYDN